MINYIFADLYRIFSKRGTYIFFVIAFAFTFAFELIMGQGSGADTAFGVFSFMNMFFGTYLFAVIYNDDLGAKTLPSLIGFGYGRTSIMLSKIVISLIVTLFMYAVAAVLLLLILAVMGAGGGNITGSVISAALEHVFILIAYFKIAALLVYGTQKAGLSIVFFLLLVLSVIDQLVSGILSAEAIYNVIGDAGRFTVGSIVWNMMHRPSPATIIPYTALLAVFAALAILAFRKKELEF
jgi:hypothetical protein